jgi:hypothetical protein
LPARTRSRRRRGETLSPGLEPLPGCEAAPAAPLRPTAESPLSPPRIELDAALVLAESRDWARLWEWCTELEDAFPECADFAARVRVLLSQGGAGPGSDAATAALRRLLAERV